MRYKISHYIHRFIDNGKALLWSQRYILLSSTLWCWTKRFDIRSTVSDFLRILSCVLFLTLFKQMMRMNTNECGNFRKYNSTFQHHTDKKLFFNCWSSYWIKQTSLVFLNGNYTTPSVYYLKLLQHAICLNRFLMNVFAMHRFFVRNIALAKWHCG